jgi:recombination protein U
MANWRKFENNLRRTCLSYRRDGHALIQYIDVPVVGNTMKQSTVDFLGCYGPDGKGIAFDAKQTSSKTSFPLSDIRQHQYEFLKLFDEVGGDAFLFIQFIKVQDESKFFKTPIIFIKDYWEGKKGRKSIPFKEFKDSWIVTVKDFLCIY